MLFMCVCVCAYVSEMNVSNDTRDGMEELGIFCYYKELTKLYFYKKVELG